MRFAAALTATGLLSFLILEIAKIVLEPVVAYLLAVLAAGVAIAFKIAMIGLVLMLGVGAIGVGIYVYRRTRQDPLDA